MGGQYACIISGIGTTALGLGYSLSTLVMGLIVTHHVSITSINLMFAFHKKILLPCIVLFAVHGRVEHIFRSVEYFQPMGWPHFLLFWFR